MNYTTGQYVRTYPDGYGTFCLYKVTGHQGDLLIVDEIGHNGEVSVTGLTVHPDTVELFALIHNAGSYQLGDTVRALGHEGTWIVLYFTESRTHGELLTALESTVEKDNGSGVVYKPLMLVPAHYVKVLA